MHENLRNSQHAEYRKRGRPDLIVQLPEVESQDEALARWKRKLANPGLTEEVIVAYRQALDMENERSFDAAKRSYEELLTRCPDFASAACRLGYVLEAMGRQGEAAAAYADAVRRDPEFDLAFFRLGLMKKLQGDRDGAVAAYRRAIELSPRNCAARSNLGLLFVDRREWEAAEAEFRSILDFFPDAENARTNLSAAQRRVGREGCFIATAVMGSSSARQVEVLRKYRDERLKPRRSGRVLIFIYYLLSPPIARFLAQHRHCRALVRCLIVDPLAKVVQRSDGVGSDTRTLTASAEIKRAELHSGSRNGCSGDQDDGSLVSD